MKPICLWCSDGTKWRPGGQIELENRLLTAVPKEHVAQNHGPKRGENLSPVSCHSSASPRYSQLPKKAPETHQDSCRSVPNEPHHPLQLPHLSAKIDRKKQSSPKKCQDPAPKPARKAPKAIIGFDALSPAICIQNDSRRSDELLQNLRTTMCFTSHLFV